MKKPNTASRIVFVVIQLTGLAGGGLLAQDCGPDILACTPAADPGDPQLIEDFVTDLTYSPALRQLWVIEGPIPGNNNLTRSRITAYDEGLRSGRRSFDVSFADAALGIEEVPAHHPLPGNFYVLTPGTFTGPGRIILDPKIGIMDPNGNLVAGGAMRRITNNVGIAPRGFFSCLDAHPSENELVVLDDGRLGTPMAIYFVDTNFRILRGPFTLVGSDTFYGSGVAYSGAGTVLVIAQFHSLFEARVAMEYDRLTGNYTGRSVSLQDVLGDLPQLPVGLDSGSVQGNPALFLYDAMTDAVYAAPLSPPGLGPAPGPVVGLDPACFVDDAGRVHLTWNPNPGFAYDSIAVRENGVVVEVLPASATEYRSESPAAGKYEICLETRVGGEPNAISVCCEGQSAGQLPFDLQFPASRVDMDTDPTALDDEIQMGIACPSVVDRKEDFRLYIIGTFDNQVRVVDFQRQLLVGETIPTAPARQSVFEPGFQDFAATGLALLEVGVQGQQAQMYAVLDADGQDGSFIPRGSIHFLKDTALPGGNVTAGTRLGTDMVIQIPGDEGRFLVDWDADASNDLITLDSEGRRILRIRFDPAAGTLVAISQAPLPLSTLTPFSGRSFPLGGISVLPSGHYLVAGGDTFDTTSTRAFLLTPFIGPANNPDPGSVKLVGQVEGLLTMTQIPGFGDFGIHQGPDLSLGLESVFFRGEGPAGTGALYYDLWHYFPTDLLGFRGNFLLGVTSAVSHPNLVAEPLEDIETTVAARGTLVVDPPAASFANQVATMDYHCQVFNTTPGQILRVDLEILLGGQTVLKEEGLEFGEGRSLYRQVAGRPEKTIQVSIRSLSDSAQTVRVLVGATAIKTPGADPRFRRGDANDDRAVDLSDAVVLIQYQFLSGAQPTCFDAADPDDNGIIDLSDPIYIINYLFLAGPIPLQPGPQDCGVDPSADPLDPCVYTSC